jgi:hypothetical protein
MIVPSETRESKVARTHSGVRDSMMEGRGVMFDVD